MPNHQHVRTLLGNLILFIYLDLQAVCKKERAQHRLSSTSFFKFFLFGFIGFVKFRMRLLVSYLNIFSHYFYDFEVPDVFVSVKDH